MIIAAQKYIYIYIYNGEPWGIYLLAVAVQEKERTTESAIINKARWRYLCLLLKGGLAANICASAFSRGHSSCYMCWEHACSIFYVYIFLQIERERSWYIIIYYPPPLSLSLYIYIYIYLLSDQSSATPNITIKVGFANFYKKILGLSRSKWYSLENVELGQWTVKNQQC